MDITKYQGVFPAFYACYDEKGQVSSTKVKELAKYLINKGVKGLYVGGSSGECIYQSVEERMITLESVMEEAKGKVTVIAHVACNNTKDSCILAAHAQSQGVDAIASIPPIYFKLPEHAIAKYWNDISNAAPDTDFIIYNIPQLAGVALSIPLLQEMKKNPRVIGVKNSSMPVQDIQLFSDEGVIVFNGPDEQLVSGLAAGAVGGIGGTYAGMPELLIKVFELFKDGKVEEARILQNEICRIIYKMCSTYGNMYATIKEILRIQGGPDIGGVREPLANLIESDKVIAAECAKIIAETIKKYCC
ncbi:MAG: dihydrodipicolinate synthase family protein [Lachnospiraceae bacterium]